ncbi:MAG: ATP synthase F1 subunit epsilon [Candidatus Neomarinimicrobiota bacterium]
MTSFSIEIVTPTKAMEKGAVSYLRCPGMDGLFGVMQGHANAMVALDIGEIKIESSEGVNYFSTSGGFIDISEEKVLLLLQTIEKSTGIDKERAKESVERAKQRLKTKVSVIDGDRARISLLRALNRLKVIQR